MNNLFAAEFSGANILPYQGEAYYYGVVLEAEVAARYFSELAHEIEWQHDEVVIFGKRIVTARKVAWIAENGTPYAYSGTKKESLPAHRSVTEIQEIMSRICGVAFNCCLLNYYHSGEEGMSWHSDDDAPPGKENCIASVSLGAERPFRFRHKTSKEIVSLSLEYGSLLFMRGETQRYWHHALPKSKKIRQPRINLTFRILYT